MITEILQHGEENAQSGRELCNLLGGLTLRELCKAIEKERREGAPICASSGGRPGYFLADNVQEMQDYCGRLKHRERELAKTRRACERTIKTLPGRGL